MASEPRDPDTDQAPSARQGERAGDPSLQDDAEDLDNLEQNDEVIGVAVRRSLIVVVAALALVVIVILARGALRTPPEDSAIELAGPEAVVASNEVPPALRFTDQTAASGIDFTHLNGAAGDRFLPETMGAGGAFLDFDGDGDQDLVLVNSTDWQKRSSATSKLLVNDGTGKFSDRTPGSGLDFVAYGTSVTVGDVDNDGFPDLFLGAVGPNRLLLNVPDGAGSRRFQDITERAGVAGETDRWTSTSAFFDADNDGDLDLFVGNYVEWSQAIDLELDYRLVGVGRAYGQPVNYRGTYPYFYLNRGDGTFEDASELSGVRISNDASGEPVAKTLGVAPIDIDDDGLVDLVVANDTVRNFYFHNLGDGRFEELGEIVGLAYGPRGEATGAMGIDTGFFRAGTEIGIGIGNFANEMSSFYVSQGTVALFSDEAVPVGLGAPSRRVLTFGFFFFDVDLDGRLDLLQVNGHLESEIGKVEPSQTYEQAPQLFWNAGAEARRTYLPVETAGDLDRPIVGRGSAYADIDGDGDLDVLLLQTGGAAFLLRNDQAVGNDWLRIRLVGNGTTTNRDAVASWVSVRTSAGVMWRQVMPAKSYQSQSELPLTFGLPAGVLVEGITVHWAGSPRSGPGQEVSSENFLPNQSFDIVQTAR